MGKKVRVGLAKFPTNDEGRPICKKCKSPDLKRVRGRAGMLGFGIFASKTVTRCETCGKRY